MAIGEEEEQKNPINPLSIIMPKEGMEEKVDKIISPGAWLRTGPGQGISFEEWVTSVRRHSEKYQFSGIPRGLQWSDGMPDNLPLPQQQLSAGGPALLLDGNSVSPRSCDHTSELRLRDRLGNAAMMDVESNDFSWNALSSLYHTKHTSGTENSENEMNKALEVTVNSGGFVFYALFNTMKNDDASPREGAAVIKIASSRMATQSERLGYELAKWLGVQTPQARVIHNSSLEWQQIKDSAEKARDLAISAGDELGEMTCSDLSEALESSRCLFLMNYVHGSPLLDNSGAFDSREAAGNTAAALGRVLMLDLILRNEDRLPCRELGWRGNCANLLYADKGSSTNMNALERANDSAIRSYEPHFIRSVEKERRSISVNGRLASRDSLKSDELCLTSTMKHSYIDERKQSDFHIVAIDSGVPRRPPAGKRAKDQDNYPKVVELIVNSPAYSSNLLHDISGGKLGFPAANDGFKPINTSCLSKADMRGFVHEFRKGFRGALMDLMGFHIFLLTLYQKLDGLLRTFLMIISKTSGEDNVGCSDSHSNYFAFSRSSSFISETLGDSCETEPPKSARLSRVGSRENYDLVSPPCRDNWNGKYAKGNGELSHSLRLTMKLRDFHRFAKVDAEMSKQLEQWNEMLRNEVVKLCLENNFNSGFFEGSNNNVVIDAYELKVRLEHILERISLISDAGSVERPSLITDYLYIGGALAAKSRHTLQHLGITHVLCLCSNEIGHSDSQYPDLFEYRNFSVSDNDDVDISNLFEETSDFINYVEYLGGKILVHCFEGKSRSATIVLAYLMLRKEYTLAEAWKKLKKGHRRAQPNDGFAKILLELDNRLYGKVSMEWQRRRPVMKVCPICGKNAGLSSSSLKLHLQKFHKKLSSGSVDSAMKLEIDKALEALRASRGAQTQQKQP